MPNQDTNLRVILIKKECLILMKIMNRKNNRYQAQSLVWELSPSRKSGRKIAGKKEGSHLPNSVTEDVGGFSLMPHYSVKQLRRIGKQQAYSQSRGISRTTKNQWRMTPRW